MSTSSTPPPLEATYAEYRDRLVADEQAAMHAILIDAAGLPHYVGPFPSADAAFAWNYEHRNGADCAVVVLNAPWRPHREPRR